MIVSGISHNPLGGSFGFHIGDKYKKALLKSLSQSPWRVFWFPHRWDEYYDDSPSGVAIPLAGLLVSTDNSVESEVKEFNSSRNPLGGSFGFHKKTN